MPFRLGEGAPWLPRLWECGFPWQGCFSWGVSWVCGGKLKGNKLSGGGRGETQAGEALRLLRSSSQQRGWCGETRVRLRIINVRRGSAPLGHLLESFDWGQNFVNPNCWAFRRAGSHLLLDWGHLVPLAWVKVLGAIASAALGLCLYGVPELNKSSLPMWTG